MKIVLVLLYQKYPELFFLLGVRRGHYINPFVPSETFLYPLNASENLFRGYKKSFQGVKKGYIGNKWVNLMKWKAFAVFINGKRRILFDGNKANLETEVTRKQTRQISQKTKISYPPDTHTYVRVSGNKKCSFYGKSVGLCFLDSSVLRISLFSYYQCFVNNEVSHQFLFSKKQICTWRVLFYFRCR